MKRPKKTKADANQDQIITDLRALGFDVDDVHDLPGLYDIVVSGEKIIELHDMGKFEIIGGSVTCSVRVEIKTQKGKLNKTEKAYRDAQRHLGSLVTIRSVDDVLEWFGRV